MSSRHGLLSGAEEGDAVASPVILVGSDVQSADPRKNDSGQRGGAFYYRSSTGATGATVSKENLLIPLEEVLIEAGHQSGETSSNAAYFFRDPTGVNRILSVTVNTDGSVEHRVGGSGTAPISGSLVGGPSATGLFPTALWRFISVHARIASGTDGFITSFVEDQLVLDTQGIDTQGNGATEAGQIFLTGIQTTQWDDIWIRPRCILIDAPSPITGTPSIGGTLTGLTSAETAEVYAWESDTTDSEGGAGDVDLPTDTLRLFLRAVSFAPTATSGGFVDNENVTVTGLSGPTLSVDAPHAGYQLGLEPGGMFQGRGMFMERPSVDAVGTDNTDGTLVGGATDRADALTLVDDAKRIEHTAAGEVVTVNRAALANQTTVARIATTVLYLRASSDGADPNGVQGRLRDSGTAMQLTEKRLVAATQTAVQIAFDRNAAGGEWTAGAGAGGLDDVQVGYSTSTT